GAVNEHGTAQIIFAFAGRNLFFSAIVFDHWDFFRWRLNDLTPNATLVMSLVLPLRDEGGKAWGILSTGNDSRNAVSASRRPSRPMPTGRDSAGPSPN